ncbi:hypothetical protein MKW98_028328 [Papaver atlanticum]|uniref:Uncharacterized protein n=1 Tax=Papaver atlanticum TaxID=357466 RepID=A0AAD4SW21_9MAGN|nr:hypothetical protein MKW98_028328 [Papaver atlanticum]
MASSKTQQVVALSLLCLLLVGTLPRQLQDQLLVNAAGAVANDTRQECIQKCKSLGGVCLCRPARLQGCCCCCWQ